MRKILLFLMINSLFVFGCKEKEEPKVESIRFEFANINLNYSDSVLLKVNYQPSNLESPQYIWTSENEKIALVNENGFVKATGIGSVKISVSTIDKRLHASININVNRIVVLNYDSVNLNKNDSILLVAQTNPEAVFDWKSSNSNIVTVNNGLVIAKSTGNADIIVTVDGIKDTCKVYVNNPIKKIEFEDSVIILKINEKVRFDLDMINFYTITPKDADNKKVAFSFDKSYLEFFDYSNFRIYDITGIKYGSTNLFIESYDGKLSDTCKILVIPNIGFVVYDPLGNSGNAELKIDNKTDDSIMLTKIFVFDITKNVIIDRILDENLLGVVLSNGSKKITNYKYNKVNSLFRCFFRYKNVEYFADCKLII